MSEPLYLYFEGLNDPLRLVGCEHLIEHFSVLFPEWNYFVGKSHETPIISVEYQLEKYRLSTSWPSEAKCYVDEVDILCALIAKLLTAQSFNDSESLYLHAASVVINGRLIVFPSQYRAGKSFLTACMSAAGYLYFCDDVFPLALDKCKGRSPGIAPRLRMPIPDTTDAKSKHYIESHIALCGERYAYLDIDTKLRVARNELIDIGAFVLLDRRDGVCAQLEELPAAVILQQLIKQNFSREIEGSLILSVLSKAISQAQCIKISYDRADDAIRLLQEHFSSWPSPSEAFELTSNTVELQGGKADNCFVQKEGVQKISIEGESFLVSPDEKGVYHLDLIGSGIWELLVEQTSQDTIVSILTAAFPQIKSATIEKDVTTIISNLWLKNLIGASAV
ncbi:MAG: hypothetical protein ACJA2O_003638 [Candidatus Azotimanducaceae bacterium]|jgi:hypothetical protein